MMAHPSTSERAQGECEHLDDVGNRHGSHKRCGKADSGRQAPGGKFREAKSIGVAQMACGSAKIREAKSIGVGGMTGGVMVSQADPNKDHALVWHSYRQSVTHHA